MNFWKGIKTSSSKTLKANIETISIEYLYSPKTVWAAGRLPLKGENNFHTQYTRACCIRNNE